MPVRIRLSLAGPNPGDPHRHARGLHALVLGWNEEVDPDLSATLHDVDQPKPLTISPMVTTLRHLHAFDVTILVDWLVEPLLSGINRGGPVVRLGPQDFRLVKVLVVERATWAELRPRAQGFRQAQLALDSPAAVSTGSSIRRAVVLPEPELYFRSWFQRWNLCCPEPVDPGVIEVARERVVVTNASGHTKRVRIDPYREFVGYLGEVQLALLRPEEVPRELRCGLAALIRFAAYCGTGADTMRGMGQTRLIRLE